MQDYYKRNHAHQGLDTDGSPYMPAAKIGDVAGGNFTEIETDGSAIARGNATMYEDINYKLSTGKLSGLNQPDWEVLISPFYAYQFAVNDELQCPAEEVRHTWAVGTPIEVHIHMVTNGTNTNARYVKHQVKLTWANALASGGGQTTFATVETFPMEVVIPANTPDRTHIVSSVGTIKMTGGLIGSYIGAYYKRITASGTAPTNNPFIIAIGLHFQKDALGSRQMYTK